MHAQLALDYFQARTLDAEEQLLNSTVKEYEQALELNRESVCRRARFRPGSSAGLERNLRRLARRPSTLEWPARSSEHAVAVLVGKASRIVQFSLLFL